MMLHCSASACGRGSGLELRLGRVSLSGEPERGEPERGRLERGELEREGGWQPRGEADSGVVRELRSAGIDVMCGWGNGGLKWYGAYANKGSATLRPVRLQKERDKISLELFSARP